MAIEQRYTNEINARYNTVCTASVESIQRRRAPDDESSRRATLWSRDATELSRQSVVPLTRSRAATSLRSMERATAQSDGNRADGEGDRETASTGVWFSRLLPGLALTVLVGVAAKVLEAGERRWLGNPILEALVLAILIGMIVRTSWTPGMRWEPGIAFAAKTVLEVAIVLLGASVSLPLMMRAGPVLLVAIATTVLVGIVGGTLFGRALGLETRHALLVACGNAICGNSAIAAIAPVIGAKREHVASAIAFTAILGVAVIIGLPMLIPLLHLSLYQYGVLAGMTVYAVPQVLAAAFPVSTLSGEVGTLVKLVRVLMLGPVVLVLALAVRSRQQRRSRKEAGDTMGDADATLSQFIPWFITGFLVLAGARSVGVLSDAIALPMRTLSQWLTIAAMAALGLGVDLFAMRRVGARVIATVTGSLALIILVSIVVVRTLVHA
jgi:uncharacterized integral membrane protein (TIGR00698 family)